MAIREEREVTIEDCIHDALCLDPDGEGLTTQLEDELAVLRDSAASCDSYRSERDSLRKRVEELEELCFNAKNILDSDSRYRIKVLAIRSLLDALDQPAPHEGDEG